MSYDVQKRDGDPSDTFHVVLITGIDHLSMDAVAFSLADSIGTAGLITYDVRPDEEVESGCFVTRSVMDAADLVGDGSRQAETLPMDECCLTCTVKHDLANMLLAMCGVHGDVIASLPVGVEGTPVAQYLDDMSTLAEWGDFIAVTSIANAVGLDEFEERFFDDDRLCLFSGSGTDGDESALFDDRSTGVVAARLIREATHVLELPVAGSGCLSRHVDARGDCRCRDIIRVLADRNAVLYDDANEVTWKELIASAQPV